MITIIELYRIIEQKEMRIILLEKQNKDLIDKLIEKIESENFSNYTYEEVIEMLEDLKFTINKNN
jgi:aspartyl/asparaginyl-tRNA synthetase